MRTQPRRQVSWWRTLAKRSLWVEGQQVPWWLVVMFNYTAMPGPTLTIITCITVDMDMLEYSSCFRSDSNEQGYDVGILLLSIL